MAVPKVTLSAGITPSEGTTGSYLINLDIAAPIGGLTVYFNTLGSSANLGNDYNFVASTNISALTANSFTIAAGAKTANLILAAHSDKIYDPNEKVIINLVTAPAYSLTSSNVQFASHSDNSVSSYPSSVMTADINGDNALDLISTNINSHSISVLLGDNSGNFSSNTDFEVGYTPTALAVADFNNDAKIDIAVANSASNSTSVLTGDGSGNFSAATDYAVGLRPYALATADINGDTKADLISVNKNSNTISVLLNGKFTSHSDFSVGNSPNALTVADFNHDNKRDVAVTNWSSNSVSILLGNGQGGFLAKTDFTVGTNPSAVIAADFNGDSHIDLAVANTNSNTVSVLLANGSGGFLAKSDFVVGSSPQSLSSADFNGDNKIDLAVANYYTNNVSILLGNGTGSFATHIDNTVGHFPSAISTGDFNGDAKTDIVTANYLDNNLSVLLNTSKTNSVALSINDVAPPPNHSPTGTVIIDDTSPQQGQILTASNTLADVDGLGSIIYTWMAGSSVLGTGNHYTVSNNDLNKSISVIARYSDALGNNETISSKPTSAVTQAIAGFFIVANDLITSENGDTATISIKLATAPTAGRFVTLNFSSSDSTEGIVSNSVLTFTSSNWNIAQTVTVRGINDYLNDGNIAYNLNTSINASSTDVMYRQLTIAPLKLINQEDVTTQNLPVDAQAPVRIPAGTPRDTPLKIYGDAIVNTSVIDTTTGLFKVTGDLKANDVLIGLDGNDTLYGGNLQDDLSGGLGNDLLYGGYDEDFLYGESGNDTLFGEQGSDYLDGGAGNDILNGGIDDLLSDTLIGGAGNDIYYLGYGVVDSIDDKGLSTDTDTVIIPFQQSNYTLPTTVENGTISAGTQSSNLTGNSSNNTLQGNEGNNVLTALAGNDSINAGSGNDTLNGGLGNDTLTGNVGRDIFLLDTALTNNNDKITDFVVVDDTMQLENAIFTKLTVTGVLNTDYFKTASVATDSNDYLIYNKSTGALYYDADGSGATAAIQIATLGVNLVLTNADFIVIQ